MNHSPHLKYISYKRYSLRKQDIDQLSSGNVELSQAFEVKQNVFVQELHAGTASKVPAWSRPQTHRHRIVKLAPYTIGVCAKPISMGAITFVVKVFWVIHSSLIFYSLEV